MPKNEHMPKVAALGAFPADVRAALQSEVELLSPDAMAGLPAQDLAQIELAVTSAMGGADTSLVEKLTGLRRIASVGAGLDLFNLPWLEKRGIELVPTPEVMTEDAAECAVALAIAAMRNVAANDRFMRSGQWIKGRAPLGRRVSGANVGIVGLGRIGSRIAEKLCGLGCAVAYTGRSEKAVPWSFEPDILKLAAHADLLIFSCSGGTATHHLASASVLKALGPEGYLVNVSRGSVVDEDALISALTEGRIAGAGLDVFENEPKPDDRFLSLENCVLSPHAAVFTRQNRVDLIARIREILELTC